MASKGQSSALFFKWYGPGGLAPAHKESYTGYAGVQTAPGGQDIASTLDAHLQYIAASLADMPGGLDVLYEIARERKPNEILPYKEFFLKADSKQFGPKLRKAITPITGWW